MLTDLYTLFAGSVRDRGTRGDRAAALPNSHRVLEVIGQPEAKCREGNGGRVNTGSGKYRTAGQIEIVHAGDPAVGVDHAFSDIRMHARGAHMMVHTFHVV